MPEKDTKTEQTDNQIEITRPWLWKKGQSGNPEGRPKGITLKEYCRNFLASQTDEERREFLEGMDKETIWKMAEGNPESKTDLTTKGESLNAPTKEDKALAELLNNYALHSGTNIESERTDAESMGSEISNKE